MVRQSLLFLACMTSFFFPIAAFAASGDPPRVGDEAPELSLKTLSGQTVDLEMARQEGKVAVIVLRGWPGYQCRICSGQVADLLKRREDLKQIFAKIILVYPGPALNLNDHAKQFVGGNSYPEPFTVVTDPDYKFVNKWNLRWDQLRETAYPSTFIVDKDGTIRFARVSRSHGGRVKAAELISASRR